MTELMLKELNSFPTILDFNDLKQNLRLSDRSVWRMIADPRLHAYKDEDGTWNVLRSDLIAWLEEKQDDS